MEPSDSALAVTSMFTITILYDEKPSIQAIARDSDYIRYGTVTLIAGMNLITGEVIPLVREIHKSSDFFDFLKLVEERYSDVENIRIVLDNLETHTSKQVMEYLNARPGKYSFVFTPKYGPWMNIIESFFGKMSMAMLREVRVNSKEELVDRIHQYIDQVNEDPIIYRWAYKMVKWKSD